MARTGYCGKQQANGSVVSTALRMEGRCLAAAALIVAHLIRLFSTLFSRALPRQSLLHALLLARFEVKGVTLDLLNDVFLLHLSLEATKGILQRLALLQSNFCQSDHLPTNNQSRTLKLTSFGLHFRTELNANFLLERCPLTLRRKSRSRSSGI